MSSGRRPLVLLLLVAGLLTASVTAAWHWSQHLALRDLPQIDLSQLEPSVARIISDTRAEVIAVPSSGLAWGKFGSVLTAQEFFPEAARCFARAEQLDPREVRWPYLRGLCLARDDRDVALRCFRRAAELRDELPTPKVQLAELLLLEGELQEAGRHLDRARQLAPEDPRVLVALGRLAFLKQDMELALRLTTQATQSPPPRRSVHMLLCQIQQRRGDQAAVEEQLRILDAIAETGPLEDWQDPFIVEIAQYKRGTEWTLGITEALIRMGRPGEAIERLQEAGGADAADIRIVVSLGRAQLRAGQYTEAGKTLAKALQKDPTHARVHFELGKLALSTGRPQDAVTCFRQAVRLQPKFPVAHYNLGIALANLQDRDGAMAAFEQACRDMPENHPAHRELAELLLEAGRVDDALEHLQTASRLSPRDMQTQRLLHRARAMRDSPTQPATAPPPEPGNRVK